MNLFGKEPGEGNIEYKLYINPKKKDKLVSQFFFRMREGSGKAIYLLGVHDSGSLECGLPRAQQYVAIAQAAEQRIRHQGLCCTSWRQKRWQNRRERHTAEQSAARPRQVELHLEWTSEKFIKGNTGTERICTVDNPRG